MNNEIRAGIDFVQRNPITGELGAIFLNSIIKDFELSVQGIKIPEYIFRESQLPYKYIINEHVCICFWKFGEKTISKRHNEDKFDKELGFLLACYQYYKRDWSKNKRKKSLERIKSEYIKEYLLEIFTEENSMTIKQAKGYLKNLKIEEKTTS